jgi:predicted nucleic acid-binding Zn ribbon protein
MFRRDVKSLSDILSKLLREEGFEMPLNQKRLMDSWESVVGTFVARYTVEKYIKNQTLFIKIQNPALRQDLSMKKSQLVKELNAKIGSFVIADIRFY